MTADEDRTRMWVPRLPVSIPGVDEEGAHVSWLMLDDGIGYISICVLRQGLGAELGQAVESLRGARGLIIDVRGTAGEEFNPATAFRSFDLAPEDAERPGPPRFRGPIALLIDERTVRAGEEWASWFAAKQRARVFGTTTGGISSRAESHEWDDGWLRAEVPVEAPVWFLDRPLEGRGLEPDVALRCRAADLAEGRDTVVQAAARWLATAGRE